MGHHDNCFDWDYSTHPNRSEVAARCAFLLAVFRAKPKRFDRYGLSTVPGHKYIFRGMAPSTCEYLVGNYRGSDFLCLKTLRVGVAADSKVGTLPKDVRKHMREFETQLSSVVARFHSFIETAEAQANPASVLAKFVSIACIFLTKFLTIHPYANGNGHMGRLIVWILLGRFGFWPVAWPLDASPNYYTALTLHRNGTHGPLNQFLMKCIIGP